MRLGKFVEVSLSVTDLGESLPFFERLGFEKLDQSLEPWPWAVVTDGSVTLCLSQSSTPSFPILNYFASDMTARIESLQSAGVTVSPVQQREIPEVEGVLEAPGGIGVSLLHYSARRIPHQSGQPVSKCGRFGELAFPISDLEDSLTFWTAVGFKKETGSRLPFPWSTLSDGLITLGLYQSTDFPEAALIYYSEDTPERTADLTQEGFEFSGELPSLGSGSVRFLLQTPDKHLALILEQRL